MSAIDDIMFGAPAQKYLDELEYQRACIERLKLPPEIRAAPVIETPADRDRMWALIVQSAKN